MAENAGRKLATEEDVLFIRLGMVCVVAVVVCLMGMVHCEKNRHIMEVEKARVCCPGDIPDLLGG